MLKIHAPEYSATRSGQVEREQPCELCGEHEVQLIALADRKRKSLPTAMCSRCGLISHLTIPSDQELSRFYAEEYRHEYHGEQAPSAKRVVKAWACGWRIYRRLERFMRPNDRVFDIGAGLGCTAKAFELSGYDASGIEPGGEFQNYSQQQLHANVRHAQLQDVPTVPTYDFILLIHVIEHFNHPKQALRHIKKLLKPGGRLYVECPNVYAPHAAPSKLFHYGHVHNFTHRTLTMMAEAAGLRVVEQLGTVHDKDLMIVFEGGHSERLNIDSGSVQFSLDAHGRYNTLTYHLRPRYVAGRIKSLVQLFNGVYRARSRAAEIVERCSRESGDRISVAMDEIRKAA